MIMQVGWKRIKHRPWAACRCRPPRQHLHMYLPNPWHPLAIAPPLTRAPFPHRPSSNLSTPMSPPARSLPGALPRGRGGAGPGIRPWDQPLAVQGGAECGQRGRPARELVRCAAGGGAGGHRRRPGRLPARGGGVCQRAGLGHAVRGPHHPPGHQGASRLAREGGWRGCDGLVPVPCRGGRAGTAESPHPSPSLPLPGRPQRGL